MLDLPRCAAMDEDAIVDELAGVERKIVSAEIHLARLRQRLASANVQADVQVVDRTMSELMIETELLRMLMVRRKRLFEKLP